MPTRGTVPQQEVVVFVGYDGVNGKYIQVDGNGAPANDVDRIGGKAPLAVRWVIRNRTGHVVRVRLRNFDRGANGLCPVDCGDVIGCDYLSAALDHLQEVAVQSALVAAAGVNRSYSYELFVENATTEAGNAIDPELQIDE